MSTEELLADCHPIIADVGAAFYFDPATVTTGKEHGVDGFRFYFLGRGGVLGDVEATVVRSAFGYFNADLVDKMWTSAKERLAPRKAARLYLECNAELARRTLGGIDGLEAFSEAAGAINDAIDPTALALYAGVSAEPVPDDPPARALHLCTCLREARGSAHLAAIVTHGLNPEVAHFIKRPDAWEMFGHAKEAQPTVTDEDRRLLEAAEATTDRMMAAAFGVLDEAGREALRTGLGAIQTAIRGS